MPKIIENLKESILQTGKRELLEKGYGGVTIRSIADSCHIAVGTLYNYFPSKEMLVANVMLEDWVSTMERLDRNLQDISSTLDGFQAIYDAIREYAGLYRSVWYAYGGDSHISEKWHHLLVDQVMKPVGCILALSGEEHDPDPSRFISEVLIHAGCRESATFEDIGVFLTKLI